MPAKVVAFSSVGRLVQWLSENQDDIDAIVVCHMSKSEDGAEVANPAWSSMSQGQLVYLMKILDIEVDDYVRGTMHP